MSLKSEIPKRKLMDREPGKKTLKFHLQYRDILFGNIGCKCNTRQFHLSYNNIQELWFKTLKGLQLMY